MLLRLSLFAFISVAWPALNAVAAEYMISSASELRTKLASAEPGDVFVWRNGTYKDQEIRLHKTGDGAPLAGTAEEPITLVAETPGMVILTGESALNIAGRHLVVSGFRFEGVESASVIEFRESGGAESSELAHYCRVTQCTLDSLSTQDGDAPEETSSRWIMLYGTNNRVDHCYLNGKRSRAPTIEADLSYLDYSAWEKGELKVGHRIDHNLIMNRPTLPGVTNELETMRLGTSEVPLIDPDLKAANPEEPDDWKVEVPGQEIAGHITVENNYFENCDGEAEIISAKCSNNIFRNNTFVRNQGSLTLRHAHECTVEGNVFHGTGKANTGGLRITGTGHVVMNNYMHGLRGTGSRAALSIMAGESSPAPSGYNPTRDSVVAFNTLVNCTQSLRLNESLSGRVSRPAQNVRIENNIIYSHYGPPVSVDTGVNSGALDSGMFEWSGNFFDSPSGTLPAGVTASGADLHLYFDYDGFFMPSVMSPATGAGASILAAPMHRANTGPRWMQRPRITAEAKDGGSLHVIAYGVADSTALETSSDGQSWATAAVTAVSVDPVELVLEAELMAPATPLFLRVVRE